MAKYAHADFLDGGFTYFKVNCNKMILLKAYADADAYATVNVTNNICEVAVATGDFALSGADNAARVMTSAIKSGVASGNSVNGVDDLHIAFVDTLNSKVLWVTDETSDQSVTSGNTVNFPALTYTAEQPT
ncbi:hypothetical protein SAMN05216420_101393 [Nitrosospira sp. Nl5]|uniref:hypothetical protein n=1 Tax=Nitrosospira sp. Nl5 TaxID=200120 RepID=UPI000885D766|nr:hypothetical protein [Nitrosospira sp. Nl5]SCX94006.1 hypothetical protein SAMN05216420_101393 [Nitrosospira sp. Nl5]